ncbi:uncharacterized protein LOC114921302 [Xyrichtys novacula]|uniref:Uncharacterized protein LOC114921302 n=1 Tax=Xyrichtys novacula TaxID=13765 RepID=A0AAV1GAC9_XYRNO|nr:uncharacterized protein LOC114921302 [Xyrichtys novacula]
MENWSFCRKALHNEQTSPRGPEILQIQTGLCCMCVRRNSVHKLKTSPFNRTVCNDHGGSLSDREFMGTRTRDQTPALVVCLVCAKGESKTAMKERHVMDEAGHIPMRMIKDLTYSGSAWFLHHHSAAWGCNFKALLLEKPKNWDPAMSVWLQKMLTKRYSAAETWVISCCFKGSEVQGAASIKRSPKNPSVKGQIRQEESEKRPMGFKAFTERDGQLNSKGFANRYDTFKAASLHPSEEKTLFQTERNVAGVIKKNDHLSFLVQRTVQRQQSLKASRVYDDEDGFYVRRKLSLIPREKPESINKPQYKLRATPDDNKEDLSRRIITKQVELQHPEGESATERSHKNIENGERERLTYRLQAGFTHKTDNNDDKEMLSEVGDDILIMFFLPDAESETQTQGKLILDADIKRKTVNIPIKELDDPPPVPEVMEENFITEAHNSRCKCLKEILTLLEIYAAREDIKPTKVTTKSAKTEKQVKATTEKVELTETNNAASENTSINPTKQDASSEESVIPSPPSIKTIELEPAETEHTVQTSTVNKEIKEATSSPKSFNQSGTGRGDRPPRTTTTSPRYRGNNNAQKTTTKESFSGLRMREDFTIKLCRSRKKEGGVTRRPERPKESVFTSARPAKTAKTAETGAAETTLQKHDNTPSCRGLIHRTEAGWKHCMRRHSGAGLNIFPSGGPTGVSEVTGEEQKEATTITDRRGADDNGNDEYDHFYYFDGVLKRVRNNFYPHYERQRLRRRRRRRHDNT